MALKLAICSATFGFESVDFLSMVQAISRGGFAGTDLLDKHIQGFVEHGHSIQEIKSVLREYKLYPIALHALRDWQSWGREKSLLTSSPFASEEEYRKFVEGFIGECKGIGCDLVICSAWGEDGDLFRDVRSFKEVCAIAKTYDIRVAIEFLPWAALRDMKAAWEVVRGADCANGGLLVDTFHFFKGGSRIDDLRQVPVEKIFLVHFNDAPELPINSKEMCFSHRAFPGEGTFPLNQFLDVLLRERGYKGWISLEVINRENKNVDYLEIANRGRKSMQKVLNRCKL